MTFNMFNVAKICRICLAEGARNIFDHTNCSTTQSGGGVECVASLENLLEKLRYVTMTQIKENDTLPKLICDCCIVQLNISYNFKKKALENDLKLHQYIIEKGLDTTLEKNSSSPPALYYTSNISIVHNNSENTGHQINSPNVNQANPTKNIGPSTNAAVRDNDVSAKQIKNTIPHPIPIKVELLDSPIENECNNSKFIPEVNLPNPNLMVIVNDNNALLTQSIRSSNSTSTLPSSSSSSFTNENNLRDSEFLRNYVQNKISFDAASEKHNEPIKIDKRFKCMHKMLHSQNDKFLKKQIQKNLSNVSGSTLRSHGNFKVSVDLKNLILDQKENFSSVLKMRKHNKKLFYSLRRNQQKPAKQGTKLKKDEKRLKKVKDVPC